MKTEHRQEIDHICVILAHQNQGFAVPKPKHCSAAADCKKTKHMCCKVNPNIPKYHTD